MFWTLSDIRTKKINRLVCETHSTYQWPKEWGVGGYTGPVLYTGWVCMHMLCCSWKDTAWWALWNVWNGSHPYSNYSAAITILLAAWWLPNNSQLSVLSTVHTVVMHLQAVFLLLSVCFGTFSSSPSSHPNSTNKSGCFKVNNCKCIMKDGSGVINLKTMGDADGFLTRLRPVSAEDTLHSAEILLTFSSCQPFSQPENPTGGAGCKDVAACLTIR